MTPAATARAAPADKRVHIIQGEYHVSDDPGVTIVTVLGSCVAAAIRDPMSAIGGMNHFLLPGDDDEQLVRQNGIHLMESLLNGMVRRGAQPNRMEAKLFGGARIVPGLSDVGSMNITFAERFLSAAGILVIGRSVGGRLGRRVEYRPIGGLARVQPISSEPEYRSMEKAVRQPNTNAALIQLF